jgi:hypothetical protein
MRRRRVGTLVALIVVGVAIAGVASATRSHPAAATAFSELKPIQQRLLSGFAALELQGHPPADVAPQARPNAAAPPSAGGHPANYFPSDTNNCPQNRGGNVKFNQNCLNLSDPDLFGRGQAQNETFIAQDPNDPTHLVASSNDYRRGDGTCGGAYSLDNGQTWADSLPPNSFTRGTPTAASPNFGAPRQYWQAGGDTSLAWDTKGNVYFSCQVFNRGAGTSPNPDTSSALLVFRSTQNDGASWNFPGRYARAAKDNTGSVLEDKQLMAVDNNLNACGSDTSLATRVATRCTPFQDRVYVTWTEFARNGTAYIFESHSSDYGETFSKRVLVSSTSAQCTVTYGLPTGNGPCNENQFSDPFVGPDGSLYVAYSNFNNAAGHATGDDGDGGDANGDAQTNASKQENYNLVFLAKSTDGGQSFGPPVVVSRYYDLPDCATYENGQDPGRACVPEKGPTNKSFFRATNYASGAVDPTNANRVVVSFGSYINRDSKESNGCVPQGFSEFGLNLYDGVRVAGACNNDIVLSASSDGGASFTGTNTNVRQLPVATPTAAQGLSDQWFQWLAFSKAGRLAVSYYDRGYGPTQGGVPRDEYTGWSDVSLTTGPGAGVNGLSVQRVTTSSMPPPTEFSGLFWGDYTGMSADTTAHPTWSDTRAPNVTTCPTSSGAPAACFFSPQDNNDQDGYTANVPFPSGQ